MISMICKLSLTVILGIPVGLFAQNVAPANPATPSVAAPGTTIYVMGGGLYGNGGVYVTPSASFASPAPATGISLGGRAGISLNEPVYTGVQSTLQPTPLNYYNGSPITPQYTGEEAVAESGPAIRDMLPSYSREPVTQTPSMSVAEVAAQYKANHQQNVRSFSNADAQGLAGNVTIAGNKVAAIVPPAAPPTTPAAAPEPTPAPETPPVAGNLTPPITTQESSHATPGSTATNRLPATATLLPLLALVGLLSGGLGLWLCGRLSR